jgi:hypothetical protein
MIYEDCSDETVLELFWAKKWRPLKIVIVEADIPLMHQLVPLCNC